jgi:hypothetical protein
MKLHQNAVGFVPGKIQNMKRLRTSSGDIVLVLISGQGVYGLKEHSATASSSPEIPFGAEWIDAASDADSVVFVVDPLAYRTVPSGAIYLTSQISDSDFTSRGAGDVEFLDNYFLFREPGTGRFFGSDVGAPTAYTSTSFATAEAAGDNLVGMKATRANLLLFGEETIEIWDAVGGGAFPFRRIINGAIDKGCANGKTIAEIDDQVLWVADDKTVRMLQGMEPVKVSNFAIDNYLQNRPGVGDARAFTYTWAGHNYYVLRLDSRCFVFDITTGQWHERSSQGMETWAFNCSEPGHGRVYFGQDKFSYAHRTSPLGVFPVFFIDDSVYYETAPNTSAQALSYTSVPMAMSWTYQPVWGSGQRIFHDRFEIVVQTGVGNSNETDPVVSLEASDDGGETWTSLPDRAMGAQGKTFQRVVWNNLGSSYQRVYRASVSDPVPVRVMSAELTARGGRV